MKRLLSWRSIAIVTASAMAIPVSFAFAQPPTPESANTARPDESNLLPPRSTDVDDSQDGQEDEEGVDYLTRGPLHEAFADPFDRNPAPNPLVTEQPPEPIEEMPPEYRPEGDNIQWIPGYWAWDEEQEDFLWISGVWRDVPPQRRWVAGYWEQAKEGFRWVNGFWTETKAREVVYLPSPPESVEQGPSSPLPSENHFYIPGNWVYQDTDYRWQPGFWAKAQPGWVWVPSQYYWTPRGCVYRAGYWDRDLPNRGIVFTPVYFRDRVYTRPNYVYRPRYTIDTTASLLVNLFVRPSTHRYYFGDYYGGRYTDTYYPWVNYGQRSRNYDPLFAYYSVRGVGRNANTLDWVNRRYDYFASNEGFRPPRTVAAQRQFLRSNLQGNSDVDMGTLRVAAFAESLTNLATDEASGMRLQRLGAAEMENVRRQVRESTNELVDRRRRVELQANASADADSPNTTTAARADGEAQATLQLPDAINALTDQRRTESNRLDRENRRDRAVANADARLGQDGEDRSMREAREDIGQELQERFEARRQSLDEATERSADRTESAERAVENARERLQGLNRDSREPLGSNPAETQRRLPNTTTPNPLNEARPETPRRMQDALDGSSVDQSRRLDPFESLRNDTNGRRDRSPSLDLENQLQQLRREGRARPERPADWPGRQPRSDRGNAMPELPRGRGLPGVGEAINRNTPNLPGVGTPSNGRGIPGGNRGGGNNRGANSDRGNRGPAGVSDAIGNVLSGD